MIMKLHKKGIIHGIIACLILTGLVLVGSRRLLYFDPALIPYLFAILFATFGIIYRYSVWIDRPPTRTLWKKSLQLIWSGSFIRNLWQLGTTFFQQILLQRFIRKRSTYQWIMHFLIAWGTIIAFAVTFPLVYGWLHFETPPGNSELYQLYIFGFPGIVFNPDGIIGFFFFNTLNISALMVIAGIVMAFTRRFLHSGLVAVQTFANDLLPLLILFSVAATGLFLTYSTRFLHGEHYRVLSIIHCFTVVMFLVYLPFGKFFHFFQRAAQLGAKLYIQEKKTGEPALCPRCGDVYTSRVQRDDVKKVLRELGFVYSHSEGEKSMQDLCPLCRRRMLMFAQDRRLRGQFDVGMGSRIK